MAGFRTRVIDKWLPDGYRHFDEVVLTSALQRADIDRLRTFLSVNGYNNVDVSLVIPPDDQSRRIGWTRYYDQSGQCKVTSHQIPIPAQSNNLKLTFAYRTVQERQESQEQNKVVVGSIRLVFGVSAARERLLNTFFSYDDVDAGSFSATGYASPFDTQTVNSFDDPPLEFAKLNRIPGEAAILLDKAFELPFPEERFILMWLAFEAIINVHPGGGSNGEKRTRFFKCELKSDTANHEVHRLFKMRCDVFKEGAINRLVAERDAWSLYAAIQIAVMEDCDQRRAFLKGYEEYIKLEHGPMSIGAGK